MLIVMAVRSLVVSPLEFSRFATSGGPVHITNTTASSSRATARRHGSRRVPSMCDGWLGGRWWCGGRLRSMIDPPCISSFAISVVDRVPMPLISRLALCLPLPSCQEFSWCELFPRASLISSNRRVPVYERLSQTPTPTTPNTDDDHSHAQSHAQGTACHPFSHHVVADPPGTIVRVAAPWSITDEWVTGTTNTSTFTSCGCKAIARSCRIDGTVLRGLCIE